MLLPCFLFCRPCLVWMIECPTWFNPHHQTLVQWHLWAQYQGGRRGSSWDNQAPKDFHNNKTPQHPKIHARLQRLKDKRGGTQRWHGWASLWGDGTQGVSLCGSDPNRGVACKTEMWWIFPGFNILNSQFWLYSHGGRETKHNHQEIQPTLTELKGSDLFTDLSNWGGSRNNWGVSTLECRWGSYDGY